MKYYIKVLNLQSDPSTGEAFDFFKSVEDEDIFPDVKKAAAFEAADVLVLTGVFSVVVVEGSGFELSCWLFSVADVEPETATDGAAGDFDWWSVSGWLVTTVVASVAVEVCGHDEVEFDASSWIGLKEAPTENKNKDIRIHWISIMFTDIIHHEIRGNSKSTWT